MQQSIKRIKSSLAGYLLRMNAASCPYGCCIGKNARIRFRKGNPNSKRKTLRSFRTGVFV